MPRNIVLDGHVLTIQEGTHLGKYTILDELGVGSSGIVFKAQQDIIHRIVALKILNPQPTRNAQNYFVQNDKVSKLIGRFMLEARLPAFLLHPNIVPIFDICEHDQLHYYTMQYIEGTSLKRFNASSLNFIQKLEIFMQICNAVGFAHQNNMIHRDLKPQNIIITPSLTAVVVDFGIGKLLSEREDQLLSSAMNNLHTSEYRSLTEGNIVLGTPAYMPPEQVISHVHRQNRLKAKKPAYEVGLYSDVFALGVILYEMLTEKRVFPSFSSPTEAWKDRIDYLDNPQNHPIVPIDTINPTLPKELNTIIMKCLQPIPMNRYSNAHELYDVLYEFMTNYKNPKKSIDHTSRSDTSASPTLHKTHSCFYPLLVALILLLGLLSFSFIIQQNVFPQFGELHTYQKTKSEWLKQCLQDLLGGK